MSEARFLVSVASWEDRFFQGLIRDLDESPAVEEVVLFFYDDYQGWSKENRSKCKRLCSERSLAVTETELQMRKPESSWAKLHRTIKDRIPAGSHVMVDVTTTPREAIWSIFWILQVHSCAIEYAYHCPESYSADWLSREPGRPRLVYKMSGFSDPGLKTGLIILAGYDLQRTKQLIRFFEPAMTLVGVQQTTQFDDNYDKAEAHLASFSNNVDSQIFSIDSYAADHGLAAIEQAINDIGDDHNILLASLGPKLSAITLYSIHCRNPELGLVYAPSNEYNRAYSKGIGRSYRGHLC